MKTQKQLLTEHREQLDNKFQRDYPNGRFSLQHRARDLGKDFWHHDYDFWGLHWVNRRPTSHASPRGISTEMPPNGAADVKCKDIVQETYRGSSFGRSYNYTTLDDLLTGCERLKVPQDLVEAFVIRFGLRKSEGFK